MALTTNHLGLREGALEGAAELDRQLRELGGTMAPKLIRASLGKALIPTLALWRASMREGTRWHKTYKGRRVGPGFSRRNARITSGIAKDGTRAGATVSYAPEAFYNLMFIETRGFTGGRGKRKGRGATGGQRSGRKVEPDPKLVPAFKATRSTMLSTLVSELRSRIQKAVAKGAKR